MEENKPFYLAVRGILIEDNKCLMLKRSVNSKHQGGYWEFPGGKVDPGEDFASALVREFREETGLNINLMNVLRSGQWERDQYKIAYLFLRVGKIYGEVEISREHDEYAWMDKEQLKKAEVSPQLNDLREQIIVLL